VTPSAGPTPYGFAFTSGGALVVTEAFRAGKGEAAASSYIVRDGGVRSVTPSVGNGRSEICWAVVTGDDRFAFTTNFADGAVSRYAIGMDGALTLEDATAGLTEDGRPGLRDEDLSRDGRFLYAVDADSGMHLRVADRARRFARTDRIMGRPPQDRRWSRRSVIDDAHGTAVPRDMDNARELERRARR
jgi:6-phosphogluconolactonase (cycloisomerase 2 family)